MIHLPNPPCNDIELHTQNFVQSQKFQISSCHCPVSKEKRSGGEHRKCSLLYFSFSLSKTDFVLYLSYSWGTWVPRRALIKAGRGKMRGAVEENSTAGEAHWTDARQITTRERGKKPPTQFPKYQSDVFCSETTSSWEEAWTQGSLNGECCNVCPNSKC